MSLSKSSADDSTEYTEPYFRSNQEVITESDTINASLDTSIQRIQETLERWTNRGSGWGVDKIDSLYLDIANYMPFKGGSYIDLPSYYKRKKP